MGYGKQTSKFKSAFGAVPDIPKSKKYQGKSRKPVSFFDSQKMDGYTLPGGQNVDGDEDYQINIGNQESLGPQDETLHHEADPGAELLQPDSAASVPKEESPVQADKNNPLSDPAAGNPDEQSLAAEEREPKLFVDVNVANFGLQRIVVYDGDTVESLVADFVKRCPIDEFMVEKLKLLLQQQMDGVLERIDEDEDVEASDEDDGTGKKSSAKKVKEDEDGKGSTGAKHEKTPGEPFDLGAVEQPV